MMSRSSLVKVWAVVGLLLIGPSGCDSGPPVTPPPDPDTGVTPLPPDGSNPSDIYRLSIVGPSSFTLAPTQQATLQVGYMKNEVNLPGKTVTFTVKGDAKDSAFTTFTAITDNLGVARTTVTAGQALTSFQVEASASLATPVTFYITVTQAPPPPTKLAGEFTLISNFDVSTSFQGSTMADVLNIINEMSDHPDDPGRFIVDKTFEQAFKSLDPGIQSALNFFKPVLYPAVQNLLLKYIPNVVAVVKGISKSLSDLARRFEVTSTMVAATEQPTEKAMLVKHRLDKIAWTLGGLKKSYGFADVGISKNPEVLNVQLVAVTNGGITSLTVAEHTFQLNFGAFLLAGLNGLIIPLAVPGANDFGGLLKGFVNCAEVGITIDNNTNNLLGPTFWGQMCDAAISAVSSFVSGQIAKLNFGTSSQITLQGTCKTADSNNDYYLDTMTEGLWTGTFTLANNPAPITGALNNFTGSRTK